jgi:septal ring factor EnvC (AmiA/AmiB activator)
MRTVLGIGAVLLGLVGLLLCATAVVLGWWAATKSIDRIHHAAARLDRGLSEVDARLARVESRLNAVRSDLNEVRGSVATIAAENPELPRIRAEIERLVGRLDSALDRADGIADTLGAGAAGLRTAADIVDQLDGDPEATVRVRSAADKVDRAAESLNGLRARIEAAKSVRAAQLTRELAALAREAIASSERLAEGLAAARQELVVVRERTAEWRDQVVSWIYFAAIANALVWIWGGLGQVCLIGWGRRRCCGTPLSSTINPENSASNAGRA